MVRVNELMSSGDGSVFPVIWGEFHTPGEYPMTDVWAMGALPSALFVAGVWAVSGKVSLGLSVTYGSILGGCVLAMMIAGVVRLRGHLRTVDQTTANQLLQEQIQAYDLQIQRLEQYEGDREGFAQTIRILRARQAEARAKNRTIGGIRWR